MKIKQWIQWKQRLANWLLKGVKIQRHDSNFTGLLSGYDIIGLGWKYRVPGELAPQPSVVKTPYVPKYNTRTEAEHQAIRNRIQKDPKYCLHLKGGQVQIGIKDYNVLTHTFPNDKTRIRCGSCGRVWWKTDADWQDAIKMVDQSTNKPSSSEVRPTAQPQVVSNAQK